jgi:PAP2 superfamily
MPTKRICNIVLPTVLAFTPAAAIAAPNVITDWDQKAVATVQGNVPAAPRIGPTGATRIMAVMHIAMFEAVNTIDAKYDGYKGTTKPDVGCSEQAAAATAGAKVLIKMHPESATKTQQELDAYLATIPAGEAKDRGVKLGEETATRVLALRADDGNDIAYAYRPRTQPGVYVQTVPTVSWEHSTMQPFVLTSPSQFRPGPPPDLKGETWAKDYNEIKDLGGKNSTTRTPRQTEDAKFWLAAGPTMYQPFARQVVMTKDMSVVESARFMAVVTTAMMDAAIAIFDAKYTYEFWRPITAIRNGDIDGNPATERVANWEPLGVVTPMHPEYPCAHCVISGAVAGSITVLLGTDEIPEVTVTSPSAPGVTHKFTSIRALNDEIAGARIYAGFHYRNSTVVGSDLGKKVGAYVAQNSMQTLKVAAK